MIAFLRSRTGRCAAGAATAVLVLTACSGIADDAPTDADVGEFCAAYLDFTSTASDVAEKLAEVGTPAEVSDDERTGFEVFVDGLDNEGDTLRSEVETVDVPQDDREAGTAFIAYADQACDEVATGGGGAPSEAPSEAPTDAPS